MSSPMDLSGNDQFNQLSDDFLLWLKRSSPHFKMHSGIHIADLRSIGAGRGICASRDIAEDEELFVIPDDLILSVQNSEARSVLGLDDKQLGPWLSLIITMIYEYYQGEQSKWYPYFRILPSSFDTLMFWTDEQLSELQGSAVVGKIGKAAADDTILQKVVPLIQANPHHFPPRPNMPPLNSPDSQNALLCLAHRMGSIIMAYAFDIEKADEADEDTAEDGYMTDDEDEPAKGMVPLADIFNADAQRNNARLFQEEGLFVMKAIKNIHSGEEIFNDYGELPRADLLRRYGYVTDNYAQYDVVEFSLDGICKVAGLPDSEPSSTNPRLELLDNLDMLEEGYSISRVPPNGTLKDAIPEDFLVLLRALTLPVENLNRLKARNKAPKPEFSASEASFLRSLVNSRQSEYPTSIQEDESILRYLEQQNRYINDSILIRRKMAVQVRKGEKEILTQILSLLDTHLVQPDQNGSTKRPMTDDEKKSKRQRQL
ncbi:Ribosomal lysine N-methyltransferase 4 [Trichophyton interdigitale]|uniref:Ribosomal lysine N-methyltransferase 4 n=1 Tax=Trichophyton interdigitale TaxID=101480 RepID=A0A9P4YK42_9EURO|nr:Ribosomal lysine N-methyltransferase 4 [Trichophyton interdigitale]KAF3897658.1 Ribosomal lysine N-methyltransferase 4 [Trichophyton interdigitale]KAG8209039.1 Ribosomal lysine N-methyltransferase 4 [Trichophyton interdigitale]